MLGALREYTLDAWDFLLGNKYPRKAKLRELTQLLGKQTKQTNFSPVKSLSTPPIVRQPSELGWSETVTTGSVVIKQYPHHHEDF